MLCHEWKGGSFYVYGNTNDLKQRHNANPKQRKIIAGSWKCCVAALIKAAKETTYWVDEKKT